MLSKKELKEYWFLSGVLRYEELFGPKGFTLKNNGDIRGPRIAGLVERGLMEINSEKEIIVSEAGKKYLLDNKP